MKSNKVLVALVLLAGVAAVVVYRLQSSKPGVNLRPSAAVGEVLAEEVGRLLAGGGTVALISRQPPKDGPDANRERIETFEAAIRRQANLKLAVTEWLPRPPVGTMDLGVVTEEQLLAALEKHPDANVFLVLAGLPPFSQPLVGKLAARSQQLIVVSGYSANVRRWLESKVLAVAVVPRFGDLSAGNATPTTARDWFDREYLLVTPETIGTLPY